MAFTLSPETKSQLIGYFVKMLDEPEVRIIAMRPPVEVKSPDEWKRFEAGKTQYILIAIGPEQEAEMEVQRILATRKPT